MPAEVKSLSAVLARAKEKIAKAPAVADKLNRNVDDLETALTMVDAYAEEIKEHTCEVRALLGTATNGPPADADAGDESK